MVYLAILYNNVNRWVLRPFLKELMSQSALRLSGRNFHILGPAELNDPFSAKLVLQKMGHILSNVEYLSIHWWDLLGNKSKRH